MYIFQNKGWRWSEWFEKGWLQKEWGFVAQEPRLAEDICTSQDTVSGTFLYFYIFIQYFSLPGRRLMHQPGRCLWYFWLNCASFREKKQNRGQGLKCTFLKYLLQICTSFFATKTHSQKPGHVDAFPLYPAVSYIILRPQLKPTEIRLVSYIAGQKPWGSLCTNLQLQYTSLMLDS